MVVVGRISSNLGSELAESRSELAASRSEVAAIATKLAATATKLTAAATKLAAAATKLAAAATKLAASRSELTTEREFGGKHSEGRRNPGVPLPGLVTKMTPEQTPGMMLTTHFSATKETDGTSESLLQKRCVNGAGRLKHASHSHATCVQMWLSQLDKNSCNMWMNITVACKGTATLT